MGGGQVYILGATATFPGSGPRTRMPSWVWGNLARKGGVRQLAWPTHWIQQRGWGRNWPKERRRSPRMCGGQSGMTRSKARRRGSGRSDAGSGFEGLSKANWHRKAVPSGQERGRLAEAEAK